MGFSVPLKLSAGEQKARVGPPFEDALRFVATKDVMPGDVGGLGHRAWEFWWTSPSRGLKKFFVFPCKLA